MRKITALLFILISVLILTLTGCSSDDVFTKNTYSADLNGIEKVTVEVTDRELDIGVSTDNRIYIDYFDSEKEFLDIEVKNSKELTVKLAFNKNWTDFVAKKPLKEYRKIEIKVPDKLLAAISASTSNEDIKISNLSVTETIDFDVNGGNIVLERISVGNAVNITVKNGNMTGSVIGGWDDFSIRCVIKKGDCNLPTLKESGAKLFAANCNNGNINIEFTK